MNDPELAARAIGLLQSIIEHKRRARSWEQEFYPISANGNYRHGKPELKSPEVQILLRARIVQYWATCQADIPDDTLRLLQINEAKAHELIRQYTESLGTAASNGTIENQARS